GFLLGIGAAILREKRQDVFLSLDDLREDMQWPILGIFPLSEKEPQQWLRDKQPEKYPSLELAASHLKAADDLYTNLRFLPVEPGIRSLVTTSISPRDGKTLVATGLAKAAAGMGQRVLVVDANMAMPQVHSWLDVPNFEGLTEVLTNGLDPNQLIQRSPQQTNLFVLTSGQTSSASRKLMASPQMQHLMSQLHSMFDLVIYDTLSIQSSSDANFLARHVDGMLLVMSVGKTRRSLALQVLKKLQAIRLPVLGIVANQVKGADAKAIGERNGLGEAMDDDFEIFRVSSSQQSDGAS
ncbi:MAG TPA: CpsD/CapB family tyrosine-protein kinase, partial [Stenomitos sp.]